MSNVHMIVGSVVVVAYFVVLLLNLRTAASGAEFAWQKMITYVAATLLLIQFTLGFSLLGNGNSISAYHFLLGLSAILPVGMEHGFANQRPVAKDRGKIAALANVATLVLVLSTYLIGEMS